MADISEEVRARMVRLYGGLRYVQRYAPENRQWPRDLPHPSGKRPIVADLVLQEQWIDPVGGVSGIATAAWEWRDVYLIPEVEGLPVDHEYTEKDREWHKRISSQSSQV